jgi:hypothetical protein
MQNIHVAVWVASWMLVCSLLVWLLNYGHMRVTDLSYLLVKICQEALFYTSCYMARVKGNWNVFCFLRMML